MKNNISIKNPAHELTGQIVNDDWKVIEKLIRPKRATGMSFSVGYIIENSVGQEAFLKALDFSEALKSPDPARAFQAMTEAFNFERDVLARCREKKMSRVVTALDEGKIELPGGAYPVQFLIFDLAEGDIRSHPKAAQAFDLAWILRSLHHIAVGLWQLHGHGIAHQDLKPSNVLVFKGDQMKVADLGRAERQGVTSPFSEFCIPGAKSYAPPELLYGEMQPDWKCRRYGCDLYLMGSMVVFFFCGIQMTAILRDKLHPKHIWEVWPLDYRQVLPYVRDAFGKALEEIKNSIPPEIQEEMIRTIEQLCEPDPLLRGHLYNRRGHSNPYSLERYISLFDRFGKRAELGLLTSISHGS
jgi:serine/threonine protein kinase